MLPGVGSITKGYSQPSDTGVGLGDITQLIGAYKDLQ